MHASSPLLTNATPGHSEDLDEVSTQLRPPRSASASTTIRSGEAISGAQTPSVTPSSYQEHNPLFNLTSAALSDESLDHPSRRPPEQSSPSTWCSPTATTTTNRRGRVP